MLLPTAAARPARLRRAVCAHHRACIRALASQAQQQQQWQHQQQQPQGAAIAVAAAAAALAAGAATLATPADQPPSPLHVFARHALRAVCLPAAADAAASGREDRRPELARSREGDPDQRAGAAECADAAMRANAAALRAARLREWLRRSGADLAAVELAPSPALQLEGEEEENAGYGVLAGSELRGRMRAPWLGRRLGAALVPNGAAVVAARVPLSLAITPESVARDPILGPHVREMDELGLLDGRAAVVLALCVHRALGGASPLAAWIDALPRAFDGSPMWWATSGGGGGGGGGGGNDASRDLKPRLRELRGTSLAAAAAAHQRRLAAQWQRLRPAAEVMVRDAAAAAKAGGAPEQGGPSPPRAPTFGDYRWAYAVYWSRAHSLPVPVAAEQEEEQQEQQQGEAAAAAGSDGGGGGEKPQQQPQQKVRIVEGLVPGLDFCNHSLDANAWWEVKGGSGGSGGNDDGSVLLLAHRARLPRPGGELFISYGEKSNEELLLLHGFATEYNPHDAAMLPCPLPSNGGGAGGAGGSAASSSADDDGGWDEVLRARLELLHGMGLAPQLFLTAAHLRELEQDQRRLGWELQADGDALGGAAPSSSPAARRRPQPPSSDPATWRVSSARVRALPPGGRETLEAFVVPPEEVAERLRLLDEEGPQGAERASLAAVAAAADPSAPATARVEAFGWAMATLTTFVRLLELRVLALESEDEGTGPLERDLELLLEMGGGGAGEESKGGRSGSALEPWRRACVLYRAGQKRLVRGYLRAARAELQATLAELREAIDAEEREQQEQEQSELAGGGGERAAA